MYDIHFGQLVDTPFGRGKVCEFDPESLFDVKIVYLSGGTQWLESEHVTPVAYEN